jgi:hypothetical protein
MIAAMGLNSACAGLYILQNHQEDLMLDKSTWQPLISVGG